MSQTIPPILEMAKDIVTALIAVNSLTPTEAQAQMQRIHATLLSLHQAETAGTAVAPPEPLANGGQPVNWQRSIQKRAVACLECGATFRQLSARHLSTHGLTPLSYRVKYGMPRSQPLSAREVTTRRRALAQQIRPWEQARTKRAQAKL